METGKLIRNYMHAWTFIIAGVAFYTGSLISTKYVAEIVSGILLLIGIIFLLSGGWQGKKEFRKIIKK